MNYSLYETIIKKLQEYNFFKKNNTYMKKYIVDVARFLNIRNKADGDLIGSLQKGEVVEATGLTDSYWYQIKTSKNVIGWVSSKYLKLIEKDVKSNIKIKKAIVNGIAERTKLANAYLLSEKIPKISNIFDAIMFLDVENPVNIRYKKAFGSTFCNIYAVDVAFLMGIYIPRVWWLIDSIESIKKGLDIKEVLSYKKEKLSLNTVYEMNANSLTNWFDSYGLDFGWKIAKDDNEIQKKVNEGAFGIISAENKGGIGHITVVLPSSSASQYPLQSQAGSVNRMVFRTDWYKGRNFNKVVFAYYQK